MSGELTRRQLIVAAVTGTMPPRPPISLWRHFYREEVDPAKLAGKLLEFQERFNWDFLKLNLRSPLFAEHWGAGFTYGEDDVIKPIQHHYPIQIVSDWNQVESRPYDRGPLGEALETLKIVRESLDPEVPILMTCFNPLSIAAELCPRPQDFQAYIKQAVPALGHALAAIAHTLEGFVRASLEAGADGIFYATRRWASRTLIGGDDYRHLARDHDLAILAAAGGTRNFNILHVCKSHNHLPLLADYPVQAIHWDATDPTNLSLLAGQARCTAAVMGGIRVATLQKGSPPEIVREAQEARAITRGNHWLVGAGCVIEPETPEQNLLALRREVESWSHQNT